MGFSLFVWFMKWLVWQIGSIYTVEYGKFTLYEATTVLYSVSGYS